MCGGSHDQSVRSLGGCESRSEGAGRACRVVVGRTASRRSVCCGITAGMSELSRFHRALCTRLVQTLLPFGIGAPAAESLFGEVLRAAYTEPWRHYHTLEHVGACLEALDSALEGSGVLESVKENVELALWFHDVVYDPKNT